MQTINKVILIGNVLSEPTYSSNTLSFRLATNREERKGRDRDIHQVFIIVKNTIDLSLGDRVYIEGRLQYKDKDITKPEIFAYTLTKI